MDALLLAPDVRIESVRQTRLKFFGRQTLDPAPTSPAATACALPFAARIRVPSDRGSQYTSGQFQKLLAGHGITRSMSRSGNCWDYAAMESFFSSLKTERTARKTYRTRNEAMADVFDYIGRFYNPLRRHSTIGYISPMEFEMKAEVP